MSLVEKVSSMESVTKSCFPKTWRKNVIWDM